MKDREFSQPSRPLTPMSRPESFSRSSPPNSLSPSFSTSPSLHVIITTLPPSVSVQTIMSTATVTAPSCSASGSRIPLTSPFTVPPSCSDTIYLTSYDITTTILPTIRPTRSTNPTQVIHTTDFSFYGVAAAFATNPSGPAADGGRLLPDPACYPPGFDDLRLGWVRNNNDAGDCWPDYYSPGVCPAGWGSTGVVTEGEVTTATCCPQGFTVPEGVRTADVQSVPVYCESWIENATGVYDVGQGVWSTVSSGVVRAEGIEVRWKEGDYAKPSPGGLSAGAKAGIGVGVGLGSVLLGMVSVAAWVVRRRRRRQGKKTADGESTDDQVELAREPGPAEVHGDDYRPELGGQHVGQVRAEMPVDEKAGELGEGAVNHIAELP